MTTPIPALIFVSAEAYEQLTQIAVWLEAAPDWFEFGEHQLDALEENVNGPIDEVLDSMGLEGLYCFNVETEGTGNLVAIIMRSEPDGAETEHRVKLKVQG